MKISLQLVSINAGVCDHNTVMYGQKILYCTSTQKFNCISNMAERLILLLINEINWYTATDVWMKWHTFFFPPKGKFHFNLLSWNKTVHQEPFSQHYVFFTHYHLGYLKLTLKPIIFNLLKFCWEQPEPQAMVFLGIIDTHLEGKQARTPTKCCYLFTSVLFGVHPDRGTALLNHLNTFRSPWEVIKWVWEEDGNMCKEQSLNTHLEEMTSYKKTGSKQKI